MYYLQFQCCGVIDSRDWETVGDGKIPESCYDHNDSYNHDDNVLPFATGCLSSLHKSTVHLLHVFFWALIWMLDLKILIFAIVFVNNTAGQEQQQQLQQITTEGKKENNTSREEEEENGIMNN